MLRWTSRLLALIVVLVLAVGASAALLLWASLPMQEGSLKLRGLGAPVEILRDADGVATISAASRIDAARATGFLHAQERFFQMDLARRSGAGELVALLGPRALPLDRQRRIFELRWGFSPPSRGTTRRYSPRRRCSSRIGLGLRAGECVRARASCSQRPAVRPRVGGNAFRGSCMHAAQQHGRALVAHHSSRTEASVALLLAAATWRMTTWRCTWTPWQRR